MISDIWTVQEPNRVLFPSLSKSEPGTEDRYWCVSLAPFCLYCKAIHSPTLNFEVLKSSFPDRRSTTLDKPPKPVSNEKYLFSKLFPSFAKRHLLGLCPGFCYFKYTVV